MKQSPHELLQWYIESGADEAVGEVPQFLHKIEKEKKPAEHPSSAPAPAPAMMQAPAAAALPSDPKSAAGEALMLADQATSREALEAAVRSFSGLAITKTATNTVFCDGNPEADIIIIGEAPGASEDAQGIPFCGKSGQLFDNMLASIGLNRHSCYLTNVMFWRPPGNRRPTDEELEICKPLVEKHIALLKPKLVIFMGGTATSTLLDKAAIGKLRQKKHLYTNRYMEASVPAYALFHPSYLLRQPLQKKLAWEDLLAIKAAIKQLI